MKRNKESKKLSKEKLHKHIENIRINRFYKNYDYADKRQEPKMLDLILLTFMVFMLTFVSIFIYRRSIVLSAIISFAVVCIVIVGLSKYRSYKHSKMIVHINELIARDMVLRDLYKKTPFEFIGYMKMVFEKIGIDNLEIIYENGIDLIGRLDGNKIAIKLYQLDDKHKVLLKDLRSFFISIKRKNIKKGIIFTTSKYSNEVAHIVEEIKEEFLIELIDKENVLELYKNAKLCPSQKRIRKHILGELEDHKKENTKKRLGVVSSSRKIVTYTLTGLVIIFMGKVTPYSRYYKIVGEILFILAGLSAIIAIITKIWTYKNKVA